MPTSSRQEHKLDMLRKDKDGLWYCICGEIAGFCPRCDCPIVCNQNRCPECNLFLDLI